MRLAEVFQRAVGGEDVGFTAYDGSRAGPADAGVRIEVRSPEALSYLASAPGELGLARAYVTGHLEIVGDVYGALTRLSELSLREVPWGQRLGLLTTLGRARLGTKVEPPPQERRLRGLRHSKARDREAIAHHYDVSNTFYEWLLGPSMAYTCAVYPSAGATLEEAQFAKHDLVARKLGLKPGMRLLDVGCGWGGMVMHAAREYGVRALGVTLSRNQAEWARKAIAEAGLSDLAEVRHLDYRDVREGDFDAVSSIGLTEHIGKAKLPAYFRALHRKLRPGGRLLNHCITRPDNRQPARTGGFINRYVFPDGELVGPGHIVSLVHDTGFEVRHEENLREHYALTLAAWSRNLDERWDEAVAEVGLGRARVWRLYLAASRLGFERNNIQLHQVLGVKLDGTSSGMPLRPDWA
ncbi:SAM-dependent methyltransferase [Saccharothrix syringae]|uniref:Class I SAM-dependent methyltransferase n=1 Tax=Saccharothrix syringae TaxID=103733 RepID=A0A5Q0HA23_SACSY|nr:cyclopropane-fatty-acyl-phospholipid synthase family protein [Saccharothrix syringae]QFZ23098.1 class I SAM-dependent methyltransferase [Saccharothrix syringae]